MHYTHLVLLLQAFIAPSTLAASSMPSVSSVSGNVSVVYTSQSGTQNSATATPTPGALPMESQCSGNASLTNFCPSCDSSIIPYGRFGAYEVACNSVYTNVTYYKNIHNASVIQCIEACMDLQECYVPVISPEGRCLLAVQELGEEPVLAKEDGYAVLLARFTGAIPPSSTTSSLSTSLPSAMSSTTHIRTCKASDISCPRCHGARVKDPLGITYEVHCNHQLYSQHHYSVQEWLTPEGCLAECDHHHWCQGATFWPEGNCELAKGDNVFPEYHKGYTAFLSIDPTYTPTSMPNSAFPTTLQPGANTSMPTTTPTPPKIPLAPGPEVNYCNQHNITCPQCNGFDVHDSAGREYRVECNLQPICAVMEGRHEHDTPNKCMLQCGAEEGCQAAIFERGDCAVCMGALESWDLYPLPHDYVVFVADCARSAVSSASVAAWSTSCLETSRVTASSTSCSETSGFVTATRGS
ncbi:hypothetical protein BDY17DRAFT_323547 [Neohortaea acidophila]|uniref:Apple domain-containing protein n=1 Tax=Neohortaea acidophila TaxID=245834 RepID=A0A6A6PZ35_9PEZI|nr:uncharacterized protein BDY17DRAFT_323547 [Neohortaea acidophila]KAF2484713.1 hypothetical protein BDY17DRAFT_323547 [Neohortaea acidophila]